MKKIKPIIVAVLLVVVMIFGLSRFRIQSVSNYQKEQKELTQELDLQMQSSSSDARGEKEIVEQEDSQTDEVTRDLEETEKAVEEEENNQDKEEKLSSPKASKKKNVNPSAEKNITGEQHKTSAKHETTRNKTPKNQTTSPTKKPTIISGPQQSSAPSSSVTNPPVEEKIRCSLVITCEQLIENRENIDPDLITYIPSNGIILAKTTVQIKKGANAYELLQAVCKAMGVPVDAEFTPLYNTYYVRGIGHIYEKQAGKKSGWTYQVNGVSPNVGASSYKLSDGDVCSWSYTCDGKK